MTNGASSVVTKRISIAMRRLLPRFRGQRSAPPWLKERRVTRLRVSDAVTRPRSSASRGRRRRRRRHAFFGSRPRWPASGSTSSCRASSSERAGRARSSSSANSAYDVRTASASARTTASRPSSSSPLAGAVGRGRRCRPRCRSSTRTSTSSPSTSRRTCPVHPTARYHKNTLIKVLKARAPGRVRSRSVIASIARRAASCSSRRAPTCDRALKKELEARDGDREDVPRDHLGRAGPSSPSRRRNRDDTERTARRFRFERSHRARSDEPLPREDARSALRPTRSTPSTRFRVEGRARAPDGRTYARVRCELETGRQHQIRVHLATPRRADRRRQALRPRRDLLRARRRRRAHGRGPRSCSSSRATRCTPRGWRSLIP